MSAAVQPGLALGPWTIERVDPERMKVMAEVLADPNPIHLDRAAVAAAGLGDRLINQGPVSFGYVLDMLREALPGAEIRDLDVRLSANVHEGDRVTAAGEVESVQETDGQRTVRCKVWLDVAEGNRALMGTATLVLASAG